MDSSPRRLGIDLGRTIVMSLEGGSKIILPGSLRVIKRLVNERFRPENCYIVSKVTPEQEIRARAWLKSDGFHELTGLPADHVEFCAERADKGPICRRLGITDFIDDRPEVLAYMEFVPHRILYRGDPADRKKFEDRLVGVIDVEEWSEIEGIYFPT